MAKNSRNRNRATAKAVIAPQARYDAAGTGRRLSGWHTPSSGPNRAITGLQKIKDRVRDIVRNDWSGVASVRVWTTNVVGTGIVPRWLTKNKELKKRIAALWRDFVKVADADMALDFYGLQLLVVRSWFMSGEVFIRIRPRRLSDGYTVPMQIQVIESDMVPLLDADVYPGMPAGNTIRQGIERDRRGRRIAYWIYKEHPGDDQTSINAGDLVRVPADLVQHIYEPLRPGQLRGVPEMAAVVTKLRNVADFDDALLERQKLANLFVGYITRQLPSGANDPLTGLPFNGAADMPMASLEPGIMQELLPGEDVKFSDPPDAGASYADFMRTQNLGVTAGTGTPYELATGDIKDVSDRSMRIVINEFRRFCEQRQWLLFIPKMCQPVYDAWLMFAQLAGELTQAEAVGAADMTWAPHGWAYIHPVQDVQAKQLEVENGFRSRSSVITERGDDPDLVDDERAADKAREEELGLSMPAPDPAADPANVAAANKANAEADLLIAQATRERSVGEAEVERLLAEADVARADATLRTAQADEAAARASAALAKAELDEAEAKCRMADVEARRALIENESEERVNALREQAAAARGEADAKAKAFAEAESFAREQRELVLAAERKRADVAALELEAARIGLEELRSA